MRSSDNLLIMLRRPSPSAFLPRIEASSARSRESPDTSCSSVAVGSCHTGGSCAESSWFSFSMLLGQIPSEPRVSWRKDARVSSCRWQVFVVTQSAKCASQFLRCRSCTSVDDVLQHMDAVLPGRGTVRRHVPGICIPPRAGGCQLVHRPQLIFCTCPSLLF